MLEWLSVGLASFTGCACWWQVARGDRRLAGRWAVAFLLSMTASVVRFRHDLAMQKLVSYLIMPLGLLWLTLLLWGLWLIARRERLHGGLGLGLFLALGVLGNAWVAGWLEASVEGSVPTVGFSDCPPLEVVQVLGGGAGTNQRGQPELTDSGDRVFLGARLFLSRKAERLVTSGSGIPGLSDVDLSDVTQRLWTELGIPPDRIIRLPEPRNTSQEVAAFAALVRKEGWTRVGILSSANHLPRAFARAREAGLSPVLIAADHRSSSPYVHPSVLVPTPKNLADVQDAVWETIGRWVGR